jgi:hypothetical protein
MTARVGLRGPTQLTWEVRRYGIGPQETLVGATLLLECAAAPYPLHCTVMLVMLTDVTPKKARKRTGARQPTAPVPPTEPPRNRCPETARVHRPQGPENSRTGARRRRPA